MRRLRSGPADHQSGGGGQKPGEGTICLAVSPSLKAHKISGRARLFEVKQRLREIKALTGKEIDFIIATPRMQRYLDVSAEIYGIYLKYVSPTDIHVYS